MSRASSALSSSGDRGKPGDPYVQNQHRSECPEPAACCPLSVTGGSRGSVCPEPAPLRMSRASSALPSIGDRGKPRGSVCPEPAPLRMSRASSALPSIGGRGKLELGRQVGVAHSGDLLVVGAVPLYRLRHRRPRPLPPQCLHCSL